MQFVSKISNFFGINDENYMDDPASYMEQPKNVRKNPQPSKQKMNSTGQLNAVEESKPLRKKQAPVTEQARPQKQPNFRPQAAAPTSARRQTSTSNEYQVPVQEIREKPVNRKVVTLSQEQAFMSTKSLHRDNANKILIVEPRAYSEAMTIAKHVINGESVLVNFHLIEENQARRIVDFLTGAVYAEDGDIKRVADEIFLCTPSGVEIDGTAQSLADSHMFDF